MQPSRKPQENDIVRVMPLACIVVLIMSAAAPWLFRWLLINDHVGYGPARATRHDIQVIELYVWKIALDDYLTFSKLPTNVPISTSADFVAKWPADEFLRSWLDDLRERGRLSTNGRIVDPYGSPYNIRINREASTEGTGISFRVIAWSSGPNRRNENGKGDDVLGGPFTITIDPSRLPWDSNQ